MANDPNCRAKDVFGHLCTDKYGDLWDRPGSGPRPGTVCFFEEIRRQLDRGAPRPDFDAARALVKERSA